MKYDVIILGFGKAGKTLAGAFAKEGKTVALIEKSKMMYGGTCINVGCIPSKSLVKSAESSAKHIGRSFEEKSWRYGDAVREKRRVTEFLRDKNFKKLNDLDNVTIYDGIGSFLSSTEIEVLQSDGNVEVLEGEKIFINTGATAIEPNIPGIKNNPRVYTSETLMDEDKLPKDLILIGAGYIGMEFASMYANFGSSVTVLQDGMDFLPREDRDVADEIKAIMEKKGINFIIGVENIKVNGTVVTYDIEGESKRISGDAILVATGRKANTEGLNTSKAGVELTSRGAVKVNDLLQTTAPNIWALGDVNGGPQFTFVSLDDYRIVWSQLHGGDYDTKARRNVPYSVFMDTPLGRVGLTEAQAKEQNLHIRVLKMPTAAIPKAQVLGKTEGFLKAIVHSETGKILGTSLLCPEAYEMINIVKLAMDMDADYTVLRDQIYTHPTMSEAFNDLFSM